MRRPYAALISIPQHSAPTVAYRKPAYETAFLSPISGPPSRRPDRRVAHLITATFSPITGPLSLPSHRPTSRRKHHDTCFIPF